MPKHRTLLHTRQIEFRCYRLADGMWEIEGELRDFRDYETSGLEKPMLAVGEFVHHMVISAIVDDELTVQAIKTRMDTTPFRICREVEDSLNAMVGARMGPGWRRIINQRVGGIAGCTHLRELLTNMATAALQTVPTWHTEQARKSRRETDQRARPLNLGQCHTFRDDGAVVRQYFPHLYSPSASTTSSEEG